jgi:hypothetical protein
VDHSDPVWTGSSNRFYTNQPIRIWFTMPVERACVESFDNISISAITYQGTGTTVDLVSQGYFQPPELDENGTMLLIKPDMEAFPEGIPPNSDITIRLDLNIRYNAYTDIDGGAGLRMARPFTIRYGTTGGPDKSVPQVLHIRGAERETDASLFKPSLPAQTIHYRQNKAELYLLFNAYKPTETPIRDVVIYELPESAATGTMCPVEELFWNAGGSLEALYTRAYADEFLSPPLSGNSRTKVRHSIRSGSAERVELYILPEDMLGNKVTVAEAKAQNYVMPVIIDPPPEPVALARPVYNEAEQRIELRWTAPVDTSLEGVTVLKVEWKKNGVEIGMPNSTIPAVGDSRFAAGAWDVPNINGDNEDEYTIAIRALDGYENFSLSEPVTVRADVNPPKPITGFNAAYNSADQTITVSWNDPGQTDLQDLSISWTKDGVPAGGPVRVGKDARSYTLSGVSNDSAVYRFAIIALDTSGNESAFVETGLSPGGGSLYVPPVTGLAAAYDPAAQAISAGWTNPADQAYTGLTLGWNNGAGVSGSVDLDKTGSYTISGIAPNSGAYDITVTAKNGGIPATAITARVNTTLTPPPVSGLAGAYNSAEETISISWANPAETAFTGLALGWSNGADVVGSADPGKTDSYNITGIANNSGLYTITVRALNGAALSDSAVLQVNTAVTPPVTGLVAAYNPTAQAIAVNWKNPANASAFTGLTLAWDNAEGVSGSIDPGKVSSHAITGIAGNSGVYAISVTVKDGAASSASVVTQADTAVAPSPPETPPVTPPETPPATPPVTGLSAAYDPAARTIAVNWTNPADPAAFTGLTLGWDNAAGGSGSAELGKVSAHTISAIANNTGTYTVTVTAKNGTVPSTPASVAAPTADQRVSAFDLTGFVTAPVVGAAPNTGAIDHAQYTGSVAWQKSDGTGAGGAFAASTAYRALVALAARPGYTFDGVAANVFSYAGAAVTSPAGTGAAIEAAIAFPATPGPADITLVIDRGEGAFSQGTFAVYKTGSPQTQTITVTGTGHSDPRWYVDGDQKGTGNSMVINAGDYAVGGHSLSLVVEKDGGYWSKEIDFSVGN